MANLCTRKLTMPTTIVAQNGSEIKQNTTITVSRLRGIVDRR